MCKSGIALKQISLVDLFYVIDVGASVPCLEYEQE